MPITGRFIQAIIRMSDFRSGLYAQAGAYCYRVARDTLGTVTLHQDYTNIKAGETYTLSAWINLPQALTGDGARVSLQAWNGSTWLKETSSAKVKDTKGQMGAAGDDTDGSRKRNKAALPRPHG